MENRIVFSDNSILSDWSVEVGNYFTDSKSFTLVAAQDYLYIGGRLPFNNLYFKFSTPNVNAATLEVEYWDGTSWIECVDVVDRTSGFTKSGNIQWTPNKRYGWERESTNYEGEQVTGLTGIVIYDLFWMRIKSSANMSAAVINWIGNIFCNDNDLYAEYPDLKKPEIIEAFSKGKINWEDQRYLASQQIIKDLIQKQIIVDKGQILDWQKYTRACVSATAELIYSNFGPGPGEAMMARAAKNYEQRLSQSIYSVDNNMDAIEDLNESTRRQGFMSR